MLKFNIVFSLDGPSKGHKIDHKIRSSECLSKSNDIAHSVASDVHVISPKMGCHGDIFSPQVFQKVWIIYTVIAYSTAS